ncbi:pollen-specific leucine-rich repeat extensin-like protein 1 [Arachis ipaensis]|uniref:pollen-specific leucine-rich repeat extensin-like protein 1 n=1 Tax=Arachis ipaensis TaxID=130454 RepID=UPI0007AFD61B|nr:pollen-specific leucine-rich repeat extensin-like protein 1 [Arachis ipaensis]
MNHPQPKKPSYEPTKAASQPSRPKAQPSKPNPQPRKPSSQPSKPNQPFSQPTKPTHEASKTTCQPVKTPLQSTKLHPQQTKSNSQRKKVPHHSKTSSQPAKTPESNKKKGNTSACRVTRSGRTVREGPIQDEDSDSHDSYESTEDELYKPPKVVGDSLYSSESDSDSGKGSQRKQKQAEAKEKHRPPKSRLADKEIDTDDSSYEGFEDEETDQLIGRPPKLQVIKRKARSISSPKHIATGSVAVSAETIKGTSSRTAKRLEKFMTFVPTPVFKAPRKNDDKV